MVQIIKDLLLITISIFIMLMLITTFVSIFWVKVPYVPTKKKAIQKIIELAKFKKNQKLYDLGCGDGGFLMNAEEQTGIKGIGYEMAPIPYLLARIKKFIFKSNIQIHLKDFLKAKINDADFIYCYLGPEATQKVGEKVLQECKKGTKIISNTFQIKNLTPSLIVEKNSQQKLPSLYIYEI